MSEKIDALCAELSLTAVANHYATYADEAAKKKRSFVEYRACKDFCVCEPYDRP